VVRGLFTRDERAVVLFLAGALLVGSLVTAVRRVDVPPPDDATAEATLPGPVDLNAAPIERLEELPGVGPVRAKAIAALRAERGGFRSVDELIDVRGIGPVTLERIRTQAVIGDSTRTTHGGDAQ